eukprot:GHRR01013828.1.p1 GENE.GHRR01013828.1~~GHRR01013828.1.p1  ORF type:complete len:116 (+),score=27.43 GHRR01013828.1:1719-2066(+)
MMVVKLAIWLMQSLQPLHSSISQLLDTITQSLDRAAAPAYVSLYVSFIGGCIAPLVRSVSGQRQAMTPLKKQRHCQEAVCKCMLTVSETVADPVGYQAMDSSSCAAEVSIATHWL